MVLINNKLYKWGDIYFSKPDLLLSPYPYNPWHKRYIYLLIDPIKINHSWIGKYTMPTDCMGFLVLHSETSPHILWGKPPIHETSIQQVGWLHPFNLLCLGYLTPPGFRNRHKDFYIFLLRDPKLNIDVLVLLGGGTCQHLTR